MPCNQRGEQCLPSEVRRTRGESVICFTHKQRAHFRGLVILFPRGLAALFLLPQEKHQCSVECRHSLLVEREHFAHLPRPPGSTWPSLPDDVCRHPGPQADAKQHSGCRRGWETSGQYGPTRRGCLPDVWTKPQEIAEDLRARVRMPRRGPRCPKKTGSLSGICL